MLPRSAARLATAWPRRTRLLPAAATGAAALGALTTTLAVARTEVGAPSLAEMAARMEALESQLRGLTATAAAVASREGGADSTADALAAGEHAALPVHRLATAPLNGREPVVVVSCGSFSPPTMMHLRILEDAKDHLESTGKYAVVGGYVSPTHSAYGKVSLVAMHHRVNMCEAAVADSTWVMVDCWECSQPAWTRTALVLKELSKRLPTIEGQKIKVMMVCGGDLLESFTVIKPDGSSLWAPEDQQIILAENGVSTQPISTTIRFPGTSL